jgi:hypothetical protein
MRKVLAPFRNGGNSNDNARRVCYGFSSCRDEL